MTDTIGEPAQPSVLTEQTRRFLAAPHTAALATVGADGAPHQTFIWYGLEPDDTILVNSLIGRRSSGGTAARRWPSPTWRTS